MPVFDLDVIVAMAEREGISLYAAEEQLSRLIGDEREEVDE